MQHFPSGYATTFDQAPLPLPTYQELETPPCIAFEMINHPTARSHEHGGVYVEFPYALPQSLIFPPYVHGISEPSTVPNPPQSVQSFIPGSPWTVLPHLPQPLEIHSNPVSSFTSPRTLADNLNSKVSLVGVRRHRCTSDHINTARL